VAEELAFLLVTYKTDRQHVLEALEFLKTRIRAASDPAHRSLYVTRIREAYNVFDEGIEALADLVFEVKEETTEIVHEDAVPKNEFPEDALVFSYENEFKLFDLYKDMEYKGYRNGYLHLSVNGENPRIETRILPIDANGKKELKILLRTPEGAAVGRGELMFQGWNEYEWDENKKIEFTMNGTDVTVPLTHEDWRDTIKRIRVNFYSSGNKASSEDYLIEKIAIY
jgi:hypothetical protein